MSAPTNTTIFTAMDLGSTLPIVATQDAHDGGTTYSPLWFKFTVPAGVTEVGPWIYGNFGSWVPILTCFRGPEGAPEQIGNTSVSRPMQIPVTAGETIYLRSVKPGGNPNPAVTTVDVLVAPATAWVQGNIAINDSTEDYPLVLFSAVDGTVLNFQHPFPAGEGVRVLITGEVMVSDAFDTNGPLIYSPGFPTALLSAPVMPSTAYNVFGTDQTSGWWAAREADGDVVFVSKAGVVSGTVYQFSSGVKTLTPNLANSVLYFVTSVSSANTPIKTLTIPGAVEATLVAGDADYILRPGMTTLLDDTFVVGYGKNDGSVNEIRRFNAAGTLLGTSANLGVDCEIEQIFTALDDPLSYWVWYQPDNITNRYRNIRVSDGTTIVDFPSYKFVEAVMQESSSATPSARFGTDFSCVPYIPRVVSAPLRMTQLPIEVAYDYAVLQSYVKGGGLLWRTPPRPLL